MAKRFDNKHVNFTLKTLLVNSFDLSAYDIDDSNMTIKEKAQKIYDLCLDEYGYPANLQRYGKGAGLVKEWFMGLPSVMNLPFYNNEVIEVLEDCKLLDKDSTEAEIDKQLNSYWDRVSILFMQLVEKDNKPFLKHYESLQA